MRIGTKSILFGGHQFILHPIFVALAWRRLYGGWPRRWQEWAGIVCHDWGYFGLGDMDGDEGANHPRLATAIMAYHCDRALVLGGESPLGHWARFVAGHSRSYAARLGIPTSPLMRADKLGTVLMPAWLYVALVWLSGEWVEYRDRWVESGVYPGRPGDGVLAWSRHLRANWARFRDPEAVAGRAYGNE